MGADFVIQQVLVLGILMGVGYIGVKKNVINDEVSNGLGRILTNIALPALIISSFNFNYSKDILNGVVMMFIYSIIINIVTIILAKFVFKKYDDEKNPVLRFAIIFANTGFMGLPLIMEFFGQEGVLYASIFSIAYHSLIWTYGDSLLSKEENESAFKKIISSPPLIAIGIGIVIFLLNVELPYIIDKPISMLSDLTLPLAMIILGEKITKLNLKEIIKDKDIYYASFIKLIITPLLAFVILRLLNANPLLTGIIVIMQSLPTAVLLVVLTQKYDGDVEFASKLSVVSHILSIITIPLIIIGMGLIN